MTPSIKVQPGRSGNSERKGVGALHSCKWREMAIEENSDREGGHEQSGLGTWQAASHG